MYSSNLYRISSSLVYILLMHTFFKKEWKPQYLSLRLGLCCDPRRRPLFPVAACTVMCFGSCTRLSTEWGSKCLARDLNFQHPESRETAHGSADTASAIKVRTRSTHALVGHPLSGVDFPRGIVIYTPARMAIYKWDNPAWLSLNTISLRLKPIWL